MLNNNHHNSQCSFAEDLISYLYDESNSAQKIEFEKHLGNCSKCVEELAALGFVRSSINDWREAEFSTLETPKIEIPYFESPNFAETSLSSEKSPLKFDRLRELFSFFPAWATAATAFAVLAVCIGIPILAVNFPNSAEVSELNETNKLTETKSDSQKTEQTLESDLMKTGDRIVKNEQREQNSIKESQTENIKSPNEIDNSLPKKDVGVSVDKITKTDRNIKNGKKPSENLMADKDQNRNNQKLNIPAAKEVPKLTDFSEEEDDSLRLADLFEEVGSK